MIVSGFTRLVHRFDDSWLFYKILRIYPFKIQDSRSSFTDFVGVAYFFMKGIAFHENAPYNKKDIVFFFFNSSSKS